MIEKEMEKEMKGKARKEDSKGREPWIRVKN